jgi:glycosyltransferase involved in cell wall biosynthesis
MKSSNQVDLLNFEYSIVITCFNAESTIGNCLYSAANQVIPPKEIIVVDDNSSDKSFEIIQKLSKEIRNMRIIQNSKNRGVSFSRNTAISQAVSIFIMIMDDDDISDSNRILFHRDSLVSGSDLSFVSSQKNYFGSYKQVFSNSEFSGSLEPMALLNLLLSGKKYLGIELFLPASTLALKKNLWSVLGGFDESFRRLEDIDFAFRASLIDSTFSFSNKILINRFHSTGIDKQSDVDQFYLTCFLNKHKLLIEGEKYNEYNDWFSVRNSYFQGDKMRLAWMVIKFLYFHPRSLVKISLGAKRILHDFFISWSKK